MTAPDDLTWDISPPRRPSLDDCGGASIQDHAQFPPDRTTMPYAAQLNQWAKQIARMGGMVPAAKFSVTFSGGTPSISQFACMPTAPEIGDFTVTDNGAGDTTITWASGTFPTSTLSPEATRNGGASGGGI